MNKIMAALIVLAVIGVSGCLSPPSPMTGAFYLDITDVKAVGSTKGTRTGTACMTSLLGLITTGDSGIKAAQEAGGITNISAVDYSSYQVFSLFGKYCTVVYGT